jgi:uncharacterized membrane protein
MTPTSLIAQISDNDPKTKKLHWQLLFAVILIFFFFMTNLTLNRLFLYQQEGDLAAYDNAIYQTTIGNFMHSTVSSSVTQYWPLVGGSVSPDHFAVSFSVLGIHFIPSIALTNALPYFFFPHPATTLLVQILAIVISAVLLFWIFSIWQIHWFVGIILSTGFLFHPATIGALTNAFHPILMATPLLLGMLVCLEKENWAIYLLLFVLAAGIQENVILTIIAISFIFFFSGKWKLGTLHFFASCLLFVVVTKLLIPAFNPRGVMPYESAYGSPLGSSMNQIILNGILNPFLTFKTFFTPEKVAWLKKLMSPFLYLNLFSPVQTLIGFVGIGPNLVSNNKAMTLMWGQYNAMALPFFVLGAGAGINVLLKFIRSRFPKSLKFAFGNLCIGLIISILIFRQWQLSGTEIPPISPKQFFRLNYTEDFKSPRYLDLKEIESLLNPNESLSAPDDFLVFNHNRKESYIFPVNIGSVNQVVFKKHDPFIPPEKIAEFRKLIEKRGLKLVKENETLVYFGLEAGH